MFKFAESALFSLIVLSICRKQLDHFVNLEWVRLADIFLQLMDFCYCGYKWSNFTLSKKINLGLTGLRLNYKCNEIKICYVTIFVIWVRIKSCLCCVSNQRNTIYVCVCVCVCVYVYIFILYIYIKNEWKHIFPKRKCWSWQCI